MRATTAHESLITSRREERRLEVEKGRQRLAGDGSGMAGDGRNGRGWQGMAAEEEEEEEEEEGRVGRRRK